MTADSETEEQVNNSSHEHNRGDNSADAKTTGQRPSSRTYVVREEICSQIRVFFFNINRAAGVVFGRRVHTEIEHNPLLRCPRFMPHRAAHRKFGKCAQSSPTPSLRPEFARRRVVADGVGRNGPFIFKFKPMMARTVCREQKSDGVSIKRSPLWASPCFRHGPFS